MSERSLEELKRTFPGRFGLWAEEVALVLRGSTSRGTVQRVREGMKNGRYQGARKIDGHWQLPLADLAEILDPTPEATPIIPAARTSTAPSSTGRRKSSIGPRLALVRSIQFWAQVFRVLGERDEAQRLEDQAAAIRAQGVLARNIERSEEEAATMQRALVGIPSAPPKGRQDRGL